MAPQFLLGNGPTAAPAQFRNFQPTGLSAQGILETIFDFRCFFRRRIKFIKLDLLFAREPSFSRSYKTRVCGLVYHARGLVYKVTLGFKGIPSKHVKSGYLEPSGIGDPIASGVVQRTSGDFPCEGEGRGLLH